MISIIENCYSIRKQVEIDAKNPITPTITECECLEDTLLHMYMHFKRKPTPKFNAMVRKIQKNANIAERKKS